ncbi:MAG: tRNA epoxyqueuosine(34) reductase QueG [Chitinophagales bacterium]
MQSVQQKYTQSIKQWATALGFSHCGIAKAEFLEAEAPRLEAWLKQQYQGEMRYLENHFDMRLDPRKLVEGAKSVISLSYNYYTTQRQNKSEENLLSPPKISMYAYGEDYHHVVKEKLKFLLQQIKEVAGDIHGRVFVDSAPVLERPWAVKSGMGWIGKHSLLLHKQQGSFFFLAEIILDLELEYDLPFPTDHCGTCTACMDACPTDAIIANQVVDGSKCISYLTIELKNAIPDEFKGKMEDWMFGCDICQSVCPWNRFSQPHHEPKFKPDTRLLNMTRRDWQEITEDLFKDIFKQSAVKRTGYDGLKRNVAFLER